MMLKWTEKTVKAEGVDLPNYQISVANFTDGVLSEEQNSLAGGIFSFLNVTLQLSRMPKAYGSMYFAPYPLFFTVAVTSFGFKDQIGSRIIVCTSGISTSVLQWIAIYSRLPPVWYLTYLDGWIIAHIVIIGILLVYHSVWYMFLHQSRKEQDQFEDLLKEMHAITIDVRDYKTWPEFLEQLSDEAAAKLITAFPEKVDKNKYFKRYQKSRERKHIRNTNNEVSQFADVVKEVQRRTPDMSCCKTLSTLLESEQLSGKARRKLINDPRYMLICNRDREKYYEGYIKRMDSNKFVKAIQKNLVDFWTFVAVMVLYSLIVILFSLWAEFQWRWTLMLLIDAVIVALLLLVFKWSWCRQRMRSFCIKYIKRIRARSPYGSRIPLNEDRKPNYKGIDSTGSEGKDKGECGGSMVGQTSNL
ncbi:uncharacterized protein LOC123532204 [Mercenaria mercenaria]|uniref:uncharacterized protein LOC123532204 n=1 Tax=Mercenaria mercenaria TaxID=6596 RepID=UPI00234F9668|nr:uncharacterized protein LOC123532204 [Mercenaria mercenaria]